MSKPVTLIMNSLLDMYNIRKEQSMTKEQFDVHQSKCNINSRIAALTTVRDQYAVRNLETTLADRQQRNDLVYCYKYNGVSYYVGRHPIQGYKSTNELHELNLPQSEWDKMGKMWVWKDTGIIESVIK